MSVGYIANNSPSDTIVHCTNETDSVTNSCNNGFYLELSDNPEVEDGFGNCVSCSNIIFSDESGVNLNSCTNCTGPTPSECLEATCNIDNSEYIPNSYDPTTSSCTNCNTVVFDENSGVVPGSCRRCDAEDRCKSNSDKLELSTMSGNWFYSKFI